MRVFENFFDLIGEMVVGDVNGGKGASDNVAFALRNDNYPILILPNHFLPYLTLPKVVGKAA